MILNRLGNKAKIAEKIQKQFPPHDIYMEMFFGAGGMYFNKPKSKYNYQELTIIGFIEDYKSLRENFKLIGSFNDSPLIDRLSDEQLVEIYEQVFTFRYKIFTAGQAKIRPWNAILAQNPNQEGAEKYRELI